MSQAMPQEIIVVEGRDDTKRLIETFGPTIKTIETGGSGGGGAPSGSAWQPQRETPGLMAYGSQASSKLVQP